MAKKDISDLPVPVTTSELAEALTQAINSTKPPQHKNQFNRKANTPWTPKDGSPKRKLKRKFYQHGLLLSEKFLTNEHIELANKLRPGLFVDGIVKVTRRRDKGIDITWPMRTSSQRMKLSSQYGLADIKQIMLRCIEEAENPRKKDDFDDDGT